MSCQDNYIGINRDAVSRSGLFASDLYGVEDLLYPLISKDSETNTEVWERVYRNAWTNLVSDVEAFIHGKFHMNSKLISRVTSEFSDEVNSGLELAGVRIQFDLSKYSRIHIISIEVWAEQAYASPEVTFYFYEDTEDGELLHTVSQALEEGKNTIFVDQDFDVDAVFVAYDPTLAELRVTTNKQYSNCTSWTKFECMFPCFGGQGSVKQINGGGINVIYDVYCSVEQFVCENLNLFKKVFWYRIGLELIQERKLGNRLNQFTTLDEGRKKELFDDYNANYQQALTNSLQSQNIYEDWVCFECKGVVSSVTSLP